MVINNRIYIYIYIYIYMRIYIIIYIFMCIYWKHCMNIYKYKYTIYKKFPLQLKSVFYPLTFVFHLLQLTLLFSDLLVDSHYYIDGLCGSTVFIGFCVSCMITCMIPKENFCLQTMNTIYGIFNFLIRPLWLKLRTGRFTL